MKHVASVRAWHPHAVRQIAAWRYTPHAVAWSNGTHNESHDRVPATPMSKRLEKTMMFELHENERLKRA